MAEILINTGRDLPEATELLRRYVSSCGTVEDAPVFKAHYLLGTILERDGDKKAAAEQYQAALSLAKSFSPARDSFESAQTSAEQRDELGLAGANLEYTSLSVLLCSAKPIRFDDARN